MRRKFTVYGLRFSKRLQQRLPLAVLKPSIIEIRKRKKIVATALTACGIETFIRTLLHTYCALIPVATVLTACGIETNVL